jgi:hypothetical protein
MGNSNPKCRHERDRLLLTTLFFHSNTFSMQAEILARSKNGVVRHQDSLYCPVRPDCIFIQPSQELHSHPGSPAWYCLVEDAVKPQLTMIDKEYAVDD